MPSPYSASLLRLHDPERVAPRDPNGFPKRGPGMTCHVTLVLVAARVARVGHRDTPLGRYGASRVAGRRRTGVGPLADQPRWAKWAGSSRSESRSSLTLDDLRHHGHFLGPTGSGKTVTLENVFKGFVLNRHTAGVFVDPKDGDAISSCSKPSPRDARDRVVLIRPDADHVVGLNPLEVLPGESEELVADQAVAILRRVLRRTGGDNAWGGRMDVVASNGIRTLMKRPGSTICDLPRSSAVTRSPGTHRSMRSSLGPICPRAVLGELRPEGAGRRFVCRAAAGPPGQALGTSHAGTGDVPSTSPSCCATGHIILVDIPKARIGEDATALLGSFFVARLWQVAQSRQDTAPAGLHCPGRVPELRRRQARRGADREPGLQRRLAPRQSVPPPAPRPGSRRSSPAP